jgi:hypothetical protein
MDRGVLGLNGVIGCFAMTELAHGSNVAGLETTATFDPASDDFVIHTPHLGATKWWIGGGLNGHARGGVCADDRAREETWGEDVCGAATGHEVSGVCRVCRVCRIGRVGLLRGPSKAGSRIRWNAGGTGCREEVARTSVLPLLPSLLNADSPAGRSRSCRA